VSKPRPGVDERLRSARERERMPWAKEPALKRVSWRGREEGFFQVGEWLIEWRKDWNWETWDWISVKPVEKSGTWRSSSKEGR